MNLITLAIPFLVFLCCSCQAANEIYKGQQVWRVDVHSEDKVQKLKKLLLDPSVMVERRNIHNEYQGNAIFRVAKKDFKKVRALLRTSGMPHKVIARDVKQRLDAEDHFNRQRRRKRSTQSLKEFDYSVYHNLEEIEQWMDTVAAKYDYITKFLIGNSLEGRPLHGLHVASNDGRKKPVLYMDAAIHAREWIAPATLMFVCNQLLTNTSYSRLLKQLDFYFVPVVNLDGFAYTWSNARLWRKTRRPYNGSSNNPLCVGVDANRNWDINFGGEGARSEPCSILYHGPSAESEPVIHHLANFLRKERSKIKGLVSLHNYGQQILYPYNYNLALAAPTESELNNTGMKMREAIKGVHGAEYECGRGSQVLYVFSGSTSDWAYEKAGIEFSYTLEVRDTGTFNFELPADQILPTGQEVMAGIEVLANTLIEKYANNGNKGSSSRIEYSFLMIHCFLRMSSTIW